MVERPPIKSFLCRKRVVCDKAIVRRAFKAAIRRSASIVLPKKRQPFLKSGKFRFSRRLLVGCKIHGLGVSFFQAGTDCVKSFLKNASLKPEIARSALAGSA